MANRYLLKRPKMKIRGNIAKPMLFVNSDIYMHMNLQL